VKKILLFIGVSVLIGCAAGVESTIDEFMTWSVNRKVEFINSLSEERQYEFLKKMFAVGVLSSEFGEVKFLDNGEFIYDYLVEPEGMAGGNPGDASFKYFIGHWRIDRGKMVLWKPKGDTHIELIADVETWGSVTAHSSNDNVLFLEFKVLSPRGQGYFDSKVLSFDTDMGSEAIRSYMEKITKKRREQTP
jgi:hypothetical protein